MLNRALILLSLTASVLAGNQASLTAKGPEDFGCKGPNAGNDVILEKSNDANEWDCITYQPPNGSNIFVTFGDPHYYSIDVFSDLNCETFAANTLMPTQDMVDQGYSSDCLLMQTAGWADWQSARIRDEVFYAGYVED